MIQPRSPQTPMDVADHYDVLDQFYRELWGEHVHHGLWKTGDEKPELAVEQLIEWIADELQLSPGDQVCDVGCGYGGTSRFLAKQHHVHVTGVTLSTAQYEFAVSKTETSEAETPTPRFLLQNWINNSFANNSFDRIVSIECFSHVENKQAFFEQMNRVLKPGGRTVVAIWLAGESPSRWQVKHLLEPICREGRLPSMCTESECRDLISNAGLKLESFTDLSKKVVKTWRICAFRVLRALATRPSVWWFLARTKSKHSIFLLTVYRILHAYRTQAMRYGVFVIEKPAEEGSF